MQNIADSNPLQVIKSHSLHSLIFLCFQKIAFFRISPPYINLLDHKSFKISYGETV
jgi:hypothetical protein